MRTRDDIWLPEQDPWGADRLDWDDEQEGSSDADEQESVPEDPRY